MRSIPTVELDNHLPIRRQVWRDAVQHRADEVIFAVKMNPLVWRAPTIKRAHRPCAQVQTNIQSNDDRADTHRTSDITKRFFITRTLRRAVRMIVMPIHDFQAPGRIRLRAERVIEVEVDFLSLATFLPVLNGPGNLRWE